MYSVPNPYRIQYPAKGGGCPQLRWPGSANPGASGPSHASSLSALAMQRDSADWLTRFRDLHGTPGSQQPPLSHGRTVIGRGLLLLSAGLLGF